MDPAYLTHTCDPNKPQSGLMEHRGVRISSISEADPSAEAAKKNLVIRNELLKRWSGGNDRCAVVLSTNTDPSP
jgi:hypothetical protein